MAPAWPAPRPVAPPAGWYPDPWRSAPYRWWNGQGWSSNVAAAVAPPQWEPPGKKRRLPEWLSVPVLCAAPLTALIIVVVAIREAIVIPLAFIPLAILVPVWLWVDRLEPEPRAARLHALLWGTSVAVAVAGLGGAAVVWATNEIVGMVVAAPLLEETMKGLGIVWAVRRKRIDGPIDGLVYGCWVATGFAMIENMLYFVVASDDGMLAQTFIARGVLTPFAHPLFTSWMGIAIGMAVAKRRKLPGAALWGWFAAMAIHAAWNGSIAWAASADETAHQALIGLGALVVFIGLFTLAIIVVVRLRESQRDQYIATMPALLHRYRVPPNEVGMFASWPQLQSARRTLDRDQRRRFDRTHAALARLAALHAQPGPTDPAAEQRLVAQLSAARSYESRP